MSLDGLRAWIGMVERKLTMRTRVFLVLVAIAIGGAGAGVYLGASAQTDRVTEGDLQAVQEELSGRIDALESRVETLEAGETSAPPPESSTPLPESSPAPEAKLKEKSGAASGGGVEPSPKGK